MTVSFKQFSTFLAQSEGETSHEKLDEIWNKILGKKKEDQDEKDKKAYPQVMTAKEKAEEKKKKEKEAADSRKSTLQKKRDDDWAKAKERIEMGTQRPGKNDAHRGELAWHRSFNEGQDHFTRREAWEKAANSAGLKIKKLNDTKWGAFRDDEKVGELKDLGSRCDGWLITED